MNYNFVLPGWGFLLVAGAIYLFYATNRSKNIRREQRRERLKEKQEELLQMLKEQENKGDNNKPNEEV